MKKILLVVSMLLFVVGCTNIKELSTMEIINKSIATKSIYPNQARTGYKYYLPRGLSTSDASDFNEIINSENANYYLYVDVVSYYNKVNDDYKVDKNAYISESVNYKDNFGYIEINKANNKYLVEIMYNYAKIEVIVEEDSLKTTISNAITILSSIEYNDQILDNLMGENILKLKEIEFNIFEAKKDVESYYIESIDKHGTYEEEEVHDSDLIN